MFEVNSIKELDSAVLTLVDPETGALMDGTTVTLAGPKHPARRAMELNLQRIARARINKKGRIELADPLEDEESTMDKVVAFTLDWTGFVRDGKPIECSDVEKRSIYQTDWLRQQVVDFLSNPTHFVKKVKND